MVSRLSNGRHWQAMHRVDLEYVIELSLGQRLEAHTYTRHLQYLRGWRSPRLLDGNRPSYSAPCIQTVLCATLPRSERPSHRQRERNSLSRRAANTWTSFSELARGSPQPMPIQSAYRPIARPSDAACDRGSRSRRRRRYGLQQHQVEVLYGEIPRGPCVLHRYCQQLATCDACHLGSGEFPVHVLWQRRYCWDSDGPMRS